MLQMSLVSALLPNRLQLMIIAALRNIVAMQFQCSHPVC
jgi:hypothetical protein